MAAIQWLEHWICNRAIRVRYRSWQDIPTIKNDKNVAFPPAMDQIQALVVLQVSTVQYPGYVNQPLYFTEISSKNGVTLIVSVLE